MPKFQQLLDDPRFPNHIVDGSVITKTDDNNNEIRFEVHSSPVFFDSGMIMANHIQADVYRDDEKIGSIKYDSDKREKWNYKDYTEYDGQDREIYQSHEPYTFDAHGDEYEKTIEYSIDDNGNEIIQTVEHTTGRDNNRDIVTTITTGVDTTSVIETITDRDTNNSVTATTTTTIDTDPDTNEKINTTTIENCDGSVEIISVTDDESRILITTIQDDLITKERHNQLDNGHEEIHTDIYQNGKLVSSVIRDFDPESEYWKESRFDGEGNLTGSAEFRQSDALENSAYYRYCLYTALYTAEYDANGNLIKEIGEIPIEIEDSRNTMSVTNEYNTDGEIIKQEIQVIDNNNDELRTTTFEISEDRQSYTITETIESYEDEDVRQKIYENNQDERTVTFKENDKIYATVNIDKETGQVTYENDKGEIKNYDSIESYNNDSESYDDKIADFGSLENVNFAVLNVVDDEKNIRTIETVLDNDGRTSYHEIKHHYIEHQNPEQGVKVTIHAVSWKDNDGDHNKKIIETWTSDEYKRNVFVDGELDESRSTIERYSSDIEDEDEKYYFDCDDINVDYYGIYDDFDDFDNPAD